MTNIPAKVKLAATAANHPCRCRSGRSFRRQSRGAAQFSLIHGTTRRSSICSDAVSPRSPRQAQLRDCPQPSLVDRLQQPCQHLLNRAAWLDCTKRLDCRYKRPALGYDAVGVGGIIHSVSIVDCRLPEVGTK